jgi:hypothetical protein
MRLIICIRYTGHLLIRSSLQNRNKRKNKTQKQKYRFFPTYEVFFVGAEKEIDAKQSSNAERFLHAGGIVIGNGNRPKCDTYMNRHV